jgi:hypothetical protein
MGRRTIRRADACDDNARNGGGSSIAWHDTPDGGIRALDSGRNRSIPLDSISINPYRNDRI